MENKSSIPAESQIASGLQSLPDVTALSMTRGQVLVYEGHYPQGLWVVLGGCVSLHGTGLATAEHRDAAASPFVLPPPSEIDTPSALTVTVTDDARLLFVPRSVALASPAVIRLIERGLLTDCSLQHPSPKDRRGPA